MERDDAFRHTLQGAGLLDEFLHYFESEANLLGSQYLSSGYTMPLNTDFKSVVKFSGRPILPPVMTDERYEEMAMYKRQAIFAETRLKARSRQKLLCRVQSIMSSIGKRSTSEMDTLNDIKPLQNDDDLQPSQHVSSETRATENIQPGSPSTNQQIANFVKMSPKSETTKDSGIASQNPDSTYEMQKRPAPENRCSAAENGTQDTMEEITDISDEESHLQQPKVSSDKTVLQTTGPPNRTVAERLGASVNTQNLETLQQGTSTLKPVQTSVHSSASGTASTASTDDTTLNYTVIRLEEQAKSQSSTTEATSEEPTTYVETKYQLSKEKETSLQPSADEKTVEQTKNQSPISEGIPEPIHQQNNTESAVQGHPRTSDGSTHDSSYTTTEDSMNSEEREEGFEPLSSTRSLLSRVAFNLEDEDGEGANGESKETQIKVGDLSVILSNKSDLKEEMLMDSPAPEVEETAVKLPSGPEVQVEPVPSNTDNDTHNPRLEEATPWPDSTPNISEIEAEQSIIKPEGSSSHPDDIEVVRKEAGVCHVEVKDQEPAATGLIPSLGSQLNGDMPGAEQNISDSSIDQYTKSESNSALYTASTDLDKYMVNSMDTIQSSLTTLPHILDELEPSLEGVREEEEEIPVVKTTVDAVRPEPMPECPNTVNLLPPAQPDEPQGVGGSQEGVNPTINPKPTFEDRSGGNNSRTTTSFAGGNKDKLATIPGQRVEDKRSSTQSPVPKPVSSASSPRKSEQSPKDVLRRGSYTLESPSPALVEAIEKRADVYTPERKAKPRCKMNPLEAILKLKDASMKPREKVEKAPRDQNKSQSAKQDPQECFDLTSSMEDLKLKPVQRTLNFDEMSGSTSTQPQSVQPSEPLEVPLNAPVTQPGAVVPSVGGKEEHLQKYLQSLSQMPQVVPNQAGRSLESPGLYQGGSGGSSPGQVDYKPTCAPVGEPQSASSMTDTTLSGDSLTQSMQLDLESLQAQMLEQQQQQLAQMLMEQQRQQLELQQEFMQHEALLLQQSTQSSPLDEQLLKHLQEKQQHLLQEQVTMQHQLRWQMQQQQMELQMKLKHLKNTHKQQKAKALKPLPSVGPAPQQGVKRKSRRKWWEQKTADGWQLNLQVDPGASDDPNLPQSRESSTGTYTDMSSQLIDPAPPRYFPDVISPPTGPNNQTSIDSHTSTGLKGSVNRSGVSVETNPFASHHQQSMSDTDHLTHKKRVSFSTDIDAMSNGSTTSRSTSRNTSRSGIYTESGAGPFYSVGGHLYPVPSIEPVIEDTEYEETSYQAANPASPARHVSKLSSHQSPTTSSSGSHSTSSNRMSPRSGNLTPRSNRSSPKVPRHVVLSGPKLSLQDTTIPPELQFKFNKVSAAAKGYLTRRLMHSDKVQNIIKTITDTAEFAINFQRESPSKNGRYTLQDRELVERVLAQLTSALYEIHEIFFEIPISERMALIAQTRALEMERRFKQQAERKAAKEKRLSAATLKAIERKKKARAAEKAMFSDVRPKSTPPSTSSPRVDKHHNIRRNYAYLMSRAMKPIQAHLSPIKPVKDTLNSKEVRSSYNQLFSRVLNRAVAMEKQSESVKQEKPRSGGTRSGGTGGVINTKRVKAKVVTGLHNVKKTAPSGNQNTNNKKAQTLRPKSTPPSSHPWK